MPSASAKVEKVASSDATDPVKQIVNMLEKRMRNLEKRKMKLDNYRSDVQNGKELNEDQKVAVSKYDQVECLLEFSKEFSKAINSVVLESARQQKKLAKKEQLERQQHEIQRLQEAFIYCHILSCFQNEDVRSDFLNGENGAVGLTSEQLSQLDQLNKLIVPGLPNDQADLMNHFHVLAENHIFLVEGKNKEIAGTTYKVLKEVLHSIKESGYFSRPSESQEEDTTSSEEMPEEHVDELVESQEEAVVMTDEVENIQPECIEEFEALQEIKVIPTSESVHEEQSPETVLNLQNGPLQEVLSPQGTFDFLQESQIDLDAPHMDPAVVAVHQMAPPPAINFAVHSYSTSPSPEEAAMQPIVNGSEPCDVSIPQPVNQVSVMPPGIPRSVAPVLASVQHSSHTDFDPTHPIPTQTFTNQSFAVMQNMIMPQAYVPVTMHHGPIPPHMTPIAVVPGLSPPVTSAGASVVPIHVPVAPVPVASVPNVGVPTDLEPDILETDEAQPTSDELIATTDVNPSSNGIANDKGNETNGYIPTYRGGYRGRGRGRSNNGYFRGKSNYNGRGGFQNHYYQDRNGYNNNYRRINNRGPRGNGNNRGRGNYRTQDSQQQQEQAQQ